VVLKFAFEELGLNEVYSFTSVSNKKSWSVMVRLGMQNTGANFEHPIIPESHPLREHVLYKITKAEWKNTANKTHQLGQSSAAFDRRRVDIGAETGAIGSYRTID